MPPKGSRSRRAIKWIQDHVTLGGDRSPKSRPASWNSGSSSALPASAHPLASDPQTSPNQATSSQLLSNKVYTESGQLPTSSSSPGGTTGAEANTSPTPTRADKLKEAGSAAWSAVGTTLKVLNESPNVFPPLKAAVDGFIACLDIVEAAAGNRRDYEDLRTDLIRNGEILKEHTTSQRQQQSPNIDLMDLASSIKEQVKHIETKRDRSGLMRLIKATEDQEDVLRCCRKIDQSFRRLQFALDLRTWENVDKLRMDSQLRALIPAEDARYNSSYANTIMRRGCTEKTREGVQADLHKWIHDPNSPKLRWMNGMAGTGKTTIAYSLCEWLEANGQLGASFFCTRTSSLCLDVSNLVPTLAYQLARHSPAFRLSLCKTLDNDPDARTRDIGKQFQKLIREPMQNVNNMETMLGGFVVVIDALDECENKPGIQVFLGELLRFATDLPLKFFLTSRPEYAIERKIQDLPSIIRLHNIEEAIVEEDIKKYLTEALSDMHPPPSTDEIAQLAKHSGKLFIYAATVVRYIFPKDKLVESDIRLRTMLAMNPKASSETRSERYQDLDRLYTVILDEAFRGLEVEEIDRKQRVLWTIVCLKEPSTPKGLAELLGLTEFQVAIAVQSLQSVLHLSEGSSLVSTLHASFPDYMLAQPRSQQFHCDEPKYSRSLADRCFRVMEQQLQFNICRLKSSSTFDKDIPDLEKWIGECISPTLFYACRYWSDHLRIASITEDLCARLVDFISHRLLFWMEVLNLRQCRSTGMAALEQAQGWLKLETGSPLAEVQQQVAEAQGFATYFFSNACSQSTPHIYISALTSYGKANRIHEWYWKRTRRLVEMKGTMMGHQRQGSISTWATGSEISAIALSPDGERFTCSQDHIIRVWDAHTGNLVAGPFEGHTKSVNSVAYSPNGKHIVSGSADTTIRVWDARTGKPVADPFEGHTDSVKSVAYSPDGRRIVSGSNDNTIRVWDALTGKPFADPFEGHTDWVKSVAYSPDGTHIVSGSDDRTIRVWDALTGKPFADPFEGHTHWVNSVAYSPDGKHIVSGSSDTTIRVWDAHTGKPVTGPFEGHTGYVKSVAYSPDGKHIVSGSDDMSIRVWDAHTSKPVADPFEGHTSTVSSVAYSPDGTHIVFGSRDTTIRVWRAHFADLGASQPEGHADCVKSIAISPNGKLIASGSYDKTIRVWDAHTGDVVGPLHQHSDFIYSVAYSPNGSHIVSGSRDKTIRVWDAHTGNIVASPLEGHTNHVNSVACSPDGTYIASGSDDTTVRVWDAHTGKPVADPFEGHTRSVKSVAYSPDGTHIVSGSDDQTIRVWDAHTGKPAADPFKGHTHSVNSVAYSRDGKHIVSCSSDMSIRVWDVHTGKPVADPFEGHTAYVNSVAYSPDGTLIASGSDDGTILVWDAHTANLVAGPFPSRAYEVNSVVFSPDGTHVHAGFGFKDFYNRSRGIRTLRLHPPLNQPAALAGTWSFQPDGWIMVNDVPFLWCPPDLHDYIPHPSESLVIGARGTMEIDYQNLALGDDWAECFVAS